MAEAPGRERRRLGVGLAMVAGAAAYAGLALGSGMDRLVADAPSLARKVPEPFAVNALRERASADLRAGRVGAAVDEARRLVARAPMEPDATATLGMALLAAGDGAGADAAFRVAAGGGWRNSATQLYWMQQSAAAEDFQRAAERYDALARQAPSWTADATISAVLESSEQGRASLAQRLATRPSWSDAYVSASSALGPAQLVKRADVLSRLATNGTTVGCRAIAPLVNRFAETGQPALAARAWRQHCPAAGPGPISDPAFATLAAEAATTPFAWAAEASGDVGVTPVSQWQRGGAVLITNSSGVTGGALRQDFFAPPGTYRLEWDAVGEDGAPSSRIIPMLGCATGGANALAAVPGKPSGRWSSPVEIEAGCATYRVRFLIASGQGGVILSRVRLAQAGGH